MIKILIFIAALPAAAFLCLCLYLYIKQDSFIFFPRPFHEEFVDIIGHNESSRFRVACGDIELQGWLVRNSPEPDIPLIIYFGGNAEDVAGQLEQLGSYPECALLIMPYRGYGDNPGVPSEQALIQDAGCIYDAVLSRTGFQPQNIILMGRSLGTGIAVQLAAARSIPRVILVSPYDSIQSMAKEMYPMMPINLLLKHTFDSIAYARNIQSDALIFYGSADEIIPPQRTRRLAETWGGTVRLAEIEGATHNTICLSTEFWEILNRFVNGETP